MKKTTSALILMSMMCAAPVMAEATSNKHIVGLFLGTANIDNDRDFAYGLEYEYKFNDTWGLGPVFEKTSNAHGGDGVYVRLISIYAHVTPSIRLGLGYGEEAIGEHSGSEDLIRASAAYDFHFDGGLGIAPTLALDFVDGERNEIFGIAFTKSF